MQLRIKDNAHLMRGLQTIWNHAHRAEKASPYTDLDQLTAVYDVLMDDTLPVAYEERLMIVVLLAREHAPLLERLDILMADVTMQGPLRPHELSAYLLSRLLEAKAEKRDLLHTGWLTTNGSYLFLFGEKNWNRTVAARAVRGRHFNYDPVPHDLFPISSLAAVLDLCRAFKVTVDFDPAPYLQEAAATHTRQASRAPVTRAGPTTLRVEFPYNAKFITHFKKTVKAYLPLFSQEDPTDPHWRIDYGDDLMGALDALASLDLHADEALTRQAEREGPSRDRMRAHEHQPLSAADSSALAKATRADPVPLPGLATALMPHQYVPLHAISRTRSLLIGDAPGLGKTLEATAILIHLNLQRVVVICPANVTAIWTDEFQTHAPGLFPHFTCEGRRPGRIPEDVRVVLCNWSILNFWVDTLNAWNADAVVIDEAHYAKSGTEAHGSARGKAAVQLCTAVRHRNGIVLQTTGTPVVNRPAELLPILEMLGITHLFGGVHAYRTRYCDPRRINVPGRASFWTYNGATNLDELHQRLVASGMYVRRNKNMLVEAGVLKKKYVNGGDASDPTAERQPLRITLNAEERAVYDTAVEDFVTWVNRMAEQECRTTGEILTDEQFIRIIQRKTASILPKISMIRNLLGQLKEPYVTAHVDALIAQGEQVVIVAHHRDVVNRYAARYGGLKIQGGMTSARVEAAKRRFNNGTAVTAPVLALSIEAGKTGHTLCLQLKNGAGPECAQMVFAEEGYVPGDEEQAQDRLWRIGQTREVTATNIIAGDTLDEGMYALRNSKRGATLKLIDGEGDTNSVAVVKYLTQWLINPHVDLGPDLASDLNFASWLNLDVQDVS